MTGQCGSAEAHALGGDGEDTRTSELRRVRPEQQRACGQRGISGDACNTLLRTALVTGTTETRSLALEEEYKLCFVLFWWQSAVNAV